MEITLKRYEPEDLPALTKLWNQIVEEGESFPGKLCLNDQEAAQMFASQTETVCAFAEGEFAGFYILHPNGIGRVAHTANASYGVSAAFRGMGIGERLVRDSLSRARANGFLGLQFNAVVATNLPAIQLYRKLGFHLVGTIPNGYLSKNSGYVDMHIFYHPVV